MSHGLSIRPDGAFDFLSLGALIHRLDPGIIPFRKATECRIHVSGGEFNCAANLADCFRLKTGIATAMVDYPIGDLIAERVRAMGVTPFYKRFAHDGVRGPNMATVYCDQGFGVRAPMVFYNRSNEAAGLLKAGDFDWQAIFAGGVRWFHSGGIFAALSPTTPGVIVEGMKAAKAQGAVVSFDLNFREKLWKISGGADKAVEVVRGIVENVDVLVGNEEDLQKGLGIPGPEVAAKSKLDPSAFFGMIDKVVAQHPNGEDRRDHAARGALDQPPLVERGRLGQRQDARGAHRRARRARPRGRRRRLRVGLLLRPADAASRPRRR